MYHFNLFFPNRQMDRLRQTSLQGDLSIAELIRRLADFGMRPENLNQILPHLSGQIILEQSGR